MSPQQIIHHYGNLFQIERAFRISKTDLKVRPFYHRLHHRIEAHVSIAFISNGIYKELERSLQNNKVPFSDARAVELIPNLHQVAQFISFIINGD